MTSFRAHQSLNNVVAVYIFEHYYKFGVYDDILAGREVTNRQMLWGSGNALIFRPILELYIKCKAYRVAQLESHDINVDM